MLTRVAAELRPTAQSLLSKGMRPQDVLRMIQVMMAACRRPNTAFLYVSEPRSCSGSCTLCLPGCSWLKQCQCHTPNTNLNLACCRTLRSGPEMPQSWQNGSLEVIASQCCTHLHVRPAYFTFWNTAEQHALRLPHMRTLFKLE